VHDCVSLRRLQGLKRALFRWAWYEWPMRHAAAVTVVSESVRQELLRQVRCDASKLRVIPNCLRDEFKPVSKPFNEADPLLLQVGTGATKNLQRTIMAVAGLPCRLKIIGRLSPKLRRLLGQCRVEYTNLTQATDQDVVEAYRQCDLVVFASSYEGFGLPIIEAQATGRPVLTSQACSMPEVAGGAACLVDAYAVDSIKAGLVRLIRERSYRQGLIEAGFENVKRFSANRIAQQYANIYEQLAPSES
jgi:glycosyltransferase involved in cell wall biosynthesis